MTMTSRSNNPSLLPIGKFQVRTTSPSPLQLMATLAPSLKLRQHYIADANHHPLPTATIGNPSPTGSVLSLGVGKRQKLALSVIPFGTGTAGLLHKNWVPSLLYRIPADDRDDGDPFK